MKLLIVNEYYNSMDIKITADIDDNELEQGPAYESSTKKEQIEVLEASSK